MLAFPLDITTYSAKALGAYCGVRTRGVLSTDNLVLTPAGGMNVSLSSGLGWLKKSDTWGAVVMIEEPVIFPVAASDGSLNRIDSIVLQIDKIANTGGAVYKQGSFASSATPPATVRDDYYDEISLYYISVPAGTTEITEANIIDKRLDETVCGLVRDGIERIPTEQLLAQSQAVFDAWFEQIKGQLSTDAAGNLQNQIDALNSRIIISTTEPPYVEGGIWFKPKE